MELGRLVDHLRAVRRQLVAEGRDALADSVLKALAELEHIDHVRGELRRREDSLGM